MERVGLIGENSIEYIDILLDIWNNGDCAVLIDWRIPYQTAVDMMKEASVSKCYIEGKILEKTSEEKENNIEFILFKKKNNSTELLDDYIYDKYRKNYSRDEAVVLYSSGTTGTAKGIILSHYAINTNADAIIDYMCPTKDDCIYIAKTLSHSSTLTGELLIALKTRMKLVISPVIVPPRYVLNNISKFKVSIICINPTLLSSYANECKLKKYNLLSLKTIYVSGAILKDKTYNLAHEVFANVAIYNVYGLSEAAPRITAQRVNCCKSNSVGTPIKGIEIAVVDDNGNIVDDGELGVIHVKTPSRFGGYISGNEKHISIYQNWLNTGDVGYFDENTELHIADRIDDVIIIDSHKIYPSDVEDQIIKNTSISECVVAKLENKGNEFIGCLYTGKYKIESNIKKKLTQALMSYEIPRFFLKCECIPHTINGKISISEVIKLLEKALETEIIL